MNLQPWRFYVVKNAGIKQKFKEACEATAMSLYEVSGWKWVSKYAFDFLVQAPLVIAIAASPKDTGIDQFMPGRGTGYAFSCCAAVQNMLLAAHALDVAALWFTLYDTSKAKEIMQIPEDLDIVSIIVLGNTKEKVRNIPRKPISELTILID